MNSEDVASLFAQALVMLREAVLSGVRLPRAPVKASSRTRRAHKSAE